jgi:CheY-like chemotaxis protein
VREVAVAALEGVGYVVAAASSGREALETIDRVGAVDIVLLDYAMLEMNGLRQCGSSARTGRRRGSY